MNSEFAVRSMRPGELELVLEWARQEGWNPGLDEGDPADFVVYPSDPVEDLSVLASPSYVVLRGRTYG
jgi:hypothetical protein